MLMVSSSRCCSPNVELAGPWIFVNGLNSDCNIEHNRTSLSSQPIFMIIHGCLSSLWLHGKSEENKFLFSNKVKKSENMIDMLRVF